MKNPQYNSNNSTFDEMMKQRMRSRNKKQKKFLEPEHHCRTCGTEVDDFMGTTLPNGLKICNQCYNRTGRNASEITWKYGSIEKILEAQQQEEK